MEDPSGNTPAPMVALEFKIEDKVRTRLRENPGASQAAQGAFGGDAEVAEQYLTYGRTLAKVPPVADEESEEAGGQRTREVADVPPTRRGVKRKQPDSTRAAVRPRAPGVGESEPRRSPRVTKQNSEEAFGDLEIIDGPKCVPWPDHRRGCRSAWVILGPQAGVERSMDSDAESTLPTAIGKVREDYPGYGWKAGHVINANFGGDGTNYANMTCLTASANGQQNGFDLPVARARTALHKAYSIMRQCGVKSPFFLKQGFGIKVTGKTSDGTWGSHYPGNCISNTLNLRAEVVNAPSADVLRRVMLVPASRNLENDIAEVLKTIEAVEAAVHEANSAATVTNERSNGKAEKGGEEEEEEF